MRTLRLCGRCGSPRAKSVGRCPGCGQRRIGGGLLVPVRICKGCGCPREAHTTRCPGCGRTAQDGMAGMAMSVGAVLLVLSWVWF